MTTRSCLWISRLTLNSFPRNLFLRSCSTLRGCQTGSISEDRSVEPHISGGFYPRTIENNVVKESQAIKLKEFKLCAAIFQNQTPTVMYTPGFSGSQIIIGNKTDVKIPAILDPNKAANLIGDIIPNRICDVIGDNPATSQPEYKARHIQKIRRWHMNRHQLKRLKKKMKTVFRKKRQQVRIRKYLRLTAVLKAIKEDGEQFNALEFVRERLQRAKEGGYVHDIWKPIDQQPGVPWIKYGSIPRKLKTYEVKVKPPPYLTKKQLKLRRKMERYK